jgi:uncharacterized protein (DUF1810 family)
MDKTPELKRFVDAHAKHFQTALKEIKTGRKSTHWMWYIFPQIQGLGFSEMSRYYAIRDLQEAEDYFRHPVLGQNLMQICHELLALDSNNALSIFGTPDDLKLRSSITLFISIHNTDPIFKAILDKFFDGAKDSVTLSIIHDQRRQSEHRNE